MLRDIITTNDVLYRAQIEQYNKTLTKRDPSWTIGFKLNIDDLKLRRNRIHILYIRDDIVVWAAFLEIKFSRLKLYSLYVLPEYRWYGIAESILKYIYHRFHTVYFYVAQANTPAIKLYDKLGCKRLDNSSNKYPHTYEHQVYIYKLHIKPTRPITSINA